MHVQVTKEGETTASIIHKDKSRTRGRWDSFRLMCWTVLIDPKNRPKDTTIIKTPNPDSQRYVSTEDPFTPDIVLRDVAKGDVSKPSNSSRSSPFPHLTELELLLLELFRPHHIQKTR